MSITDKGSVLIVGAGASVDFGMPLGGELIDYLSHKIATKGWSHQRASFGNRTVPVPPSWLDFVEDLSYGSTNDALAALVWRNLSPNGRQILETYDADLGKALKLGELLKSQTSETIDDFIAHNPSYADLAKLFIASDFLNRLFKYDHKSHQFKLKDLSIRHVKRKVEEWDETTYQYRHKSDDAGSDIEYRERNWIHLLINIVREEVRHRKDTLSQKVKIISFNYDGILEHVLSDQFNNTETLEGKDYKEFFEIIHPHGFCGTLKLPNGKNPWQLASDWSKNISVINEAQDTVQENIVSARLLAKKWIEQAEDVYAMGFAFARPNCNLLGLEEALFDGATLHYLNYNGDIGLDLAVEKILPDKVRAKVVRGTPERPISISNWIRAGNLGDMPG